MVSKPKKPEFLDLLYQEIYKINKNIPGKYKNLFKKKNKEKEKHISFGLDDLLFDLSEYNNDLSEYDNGISVIINIYSPDILNEQQIIQRRKQVMYRIKDYIISEQPIYNTFFYQNRLKNKKINYKEIDNYFKQPYLNAENNILFPIKKTPEKDKMNLVIEHIITPIHFLANDVVFNQFIKEIRKSKFPNTFYPPNKKIGS